MGVYMKNISILCSFFYNIHKIPIHVYDQTGFSFSFPEHLPVCQPTADFEFLKEQSQNFICYVTPENAFLGYIRCPAQNLHILMGPVNIIPYTDNQLAALFFRNFIPKEYHDACRDFYLQIPCMTNLEFVDILLLFHFTATGNQYTREDFFEQQDLLLPDIAGRTYHRLRPEYNEENCLSAPFDTLVKLMEQGDVTGLIRFLRTPDSEIPTFPFGNTPLRHRRNLCYYSVSMFAQIAHRSGVSLLEVTQIAASYYLQLDTAQSIEAIDICTTKAAVFFARMIADLSIPSHARSELIYCIQFIRKNTHNRITVSDVANYAGYSRTHISRIFKNELGFEPGSFIIRTKIEEAKSMLKYTDKSISEISSLLNFSNQSHFHRLFKKQCNLTPMQYRRQEQHR